MTRKMLKEEKDVMLSVRKIENSCNVGLTEHRKLIVALVRAVREDCARAAEDTAPVCDDPECAAPGRIAAEIRKGGG